MTEFKSTREAMKESLRRLAKQGIRAATNGSCSYKTPTGKKCAVGIVAPDDLLTERGYFDGSRDAICNDDERLNLIAPDGADSSKWWFRLQAFHDNSWNPLDVRRSIENQLKEIENQLKEKEPELYNFIFREK